MVENDGRTVLSAEKVEAGVRALVTGRRERIGDSELVRRIYLAMTDLADDCVAVADVLTFGHETIHNISGAIEELSACKRRLKEHLAEIATS